MEPEQRIPNSALAAGRNLAIDAVTAEITAALRERGIRSIVLKGPAIARWLYPHGGRTYDDTDLLVAPSDIEAAESLLKGLSFHHDPLDDVVGDRPWHAHSWVRGPVGAVKDLSASVDLHRTLIGVGVAAEEAWRVLSSHTAPIGILGIATEMLDEPARLLHLALHAAQDGKRLHKPLVDLDTALQRVPMESWMSARDVASELSATGSFSIGLRLLPAGAAVAEALELPRGVSLEAVLRSFGAPQQALGLEWLGRQEGLWNKFRFVMSKLFPPPAFMRAWSSIARRGRAGLVFAYLYRPLWLAFRLFPALRSIRSARRSIDE